METTIFLSVGRPFPLKFILPRSSGIKRNQEGRVNVSGLSFNSEARINLKTQATLKSAKNINVSILLLKITVTEKFSFQTTLAVVPPSKLALRQTSRGSQIVVSKSDSILRGNPPVGYATAVYTPDRKDTALMPAYVGLLLVDRDKFSNTGNLSLTELVVRTETVLRTFLTIQPEPLLTAHAVRDSPVPDGYARQLGP